MKHYLILVEGAHDAAFIGNIITYYKWAEPIKDYAVIKDSIWEKSVPKAYPFNGTELDRISPVPDFYIDNDSHFIAIKTAGGEDRIGKTLFQILSPLEYGELHALFGIFIVCDADCKSASDKREQLLKSISEVAGVVFDNENVVINEEDWIKIRIPFKTFIFPDNNNKGNLENLLLDLAAVQYKDYMQSASCYIENVACIKCSEGDISKIQNRNKALVGCIANIMKPGKANTSSIRDNQWVGDNTIKNSNSLRSFVFALREFLGILE